MGKNVIRLLLLSFFICAILYWQTKFSPWRSHLEIDIYVFYQRVEYFLQHHSFSLLKDNEYLSGTLLFFFSPLIFCLTKFNYINYLNSFFIINFILIFFHLLLYGNQKPFCRQLLFLLIMLVSGPILLFRFELIVSLLVILSLLLFKANKFNLSFFFLGLALTVKIYPILIFPYLMIILFKKHQYQKLITCSLAFLGGVFLVTLIYSTMGGNNKQIVTSLQFHSAKPVSIESIPGVIITAVSLLTTNKPPSLIGGYGIWGVKTGLSDFILTFFNWLWVSPIALFYIFIFINKKFNQQLKVGVIFCLIILFLVFSKNLHPQYVFWFITLFPLLSYTKKDSRNDYFVLFSFILIIVLTNQYIYPILYTDFIQKFYTLGIQKELFYLQALRNFSILTLLMTSLNYIFLKRSLE